jgi:hypothetical protein
MSNIRDEVHEWQMESALACYRILVPEGADEPLLEADEVCFMGVFGPLPPSAQGLSNLGLGYVAPELYFFALNDGEPIPPELWFAALSQPHLEQADQTLREKMCELWDIHASHGQRCPSVTMTAVVMATGEAITVHELDALQAVPDGGMTAADLAFDRWMGRIVKHGSAFKELNY